MGKFLNPDTPFMQLLTKLCDMILLNVLTILFSLPVITAGAALSGLYYSVGHMQDDEGSAIRDFFRGMRMNFRQATVLWLLELGVFLLILTALLFYIGMEGLSSGLLLIFLVVLGIGALLWCLASPWIIPLQARYENTIKGTLRNAVYLGSTNLFPSLYMTALNLLPLLLWLLLPYYFWYFAIFFATIWFAFAAYMNMATAKKVFAKIS